MKLFFKNKKNEIYEIKEIIAINIQKNDRIIVRIDENLDQKEIEDVKQSIKNQIGNNCILLCGGLKLEGVLRIKDHEETSKENTTEK